MLVLTVVLLVGAGGSAAPGTIELASNSVEQEKLDYIQANYGEDTEDVAAVQVYVRQLPTSNLVGLSVGLRSFALPRESPTSLTFESGTFSGAFSTGVGGTRSVSPDSGAG